MKRILGSVATVVMITLLGARVAWAADSGTFNVSRDGNYTSSGQYNFKAAKLTGGGWKTRVWGKFNVTQPTARLDAHIDAYPYSNLARRTSSGTSSYDDTMWGDTLTASSVTMRVCYEGLLWWDCTPKTVNR